MKTRFTLECAEEFDFAVLAINSHIKGYKLCWNINSSMQLNFEKKNDHNMISLEVMDFINVFQGKIFLGILTLVIFLVTLALKQVLEDLEVFLT